MSPRGTEIDDGTPEDVAALYAWANLTGARYKDFSAARREQRAQMRLQTAKQELDKELEAQTEAGASSAETARERVAAARQSEAAARAGLRAIEEEREIAEARHSARLKQQAAEQAEQMRRERTGPQPEGSSEGVGAAETAAARETGPRGEIESEMEAAPAERTASRAIRPAWLEGAAESPRAEETEAAAPVIAARTRGARTYSTPATLLDSREQVASRWPVLGALVAQIAPATARMSWPRGPVVAIAAPAGGAGRTSLAATLARALAKAGEHVLLVETVGQSLLPFYFGGGWAAESGPRWMAAREGESGAVRLATIEAVETKADKRAQERAIERVLGWSEGCDRLVLDLGPDAIWMVRRLASLKPMVLTAVKPDMNSVAGLSAMEQEFATVTDGDGKALLPFYVLNQFDPGLPLHLDIREVLRGRLAERLLTTVVRRSAAVGEALAEGMTVVDYAADAAVTHDYVDVASWLQHAAPASAEAIAAAARGVR